MISTVTWKPLIATLRTPGPRASKPESASAESPPPATAAPASAPQRDPEPQIHRLAVRMVTVGSIVALGTAGTALGGGLGWALKTASLGAEIGLISGIVVGCLAGPKLGRAAAAAMKMDPDGLNYLTYRPTVAQSIRTHSILYALGFGTVGVAAGAVLGLLDRRFWLTTAIGLGTCVIGGVARGIRAGLNTGRLSQSIREEDWNLALGAYKNPDSYWTGADRRFVAQRQVSDSKTFGDLITAFEQGTGGNCSSLAVIKAAMDRYDDNVVQVENADSGVKVRMHDGFATSLTSDELALVRKLSRLNFREDFKKKLAWVENSLARYPELTREPANSEKATQVSSDRERQRTQARNYAEICLGAMAKRAVAEHHRQARNFKQALRNLGNGEFPLSAVRLLGLRSQIVPVDRTSLNEQDSVIVCDRGHTAFVNRDSSGTLLQDSYGSPVPYTGYIEGGGLAKEAYTLKPFDLQSAVEQPQEASV